MQSTWIAGLAVAALGMGTVAAQQPAPAAAPEARHAMAPSAGFDQLKTLVGEWDAVVDGRAVHASYQLVSGGTAVMARLQPSNEPEMITLFSKDCARGTTRKELM